MKKNVIFRIAAIVLMCTLVTACFASSTFAKYTSSATGSATATVAKWSIKYNGTQLAATSAPTVTFNIFDTIKDTALATEDDVINNKVAPGTSGSFAIADILNDSEVTANIGVKVKAVDNGSNIPIKFYKDSAMTQPITVTPNTTYFVEAQDVDAGQSATGATIYWAWDFTANGDANDTALGIAAQGTAPTYTITLEIVANQVD